LPRIAHTLEQFDKILALNGSPAHSLCLCTGSLASNQGNDVPAIIRHFGEKGRVACMHMRNIKHLSFRHFRESSHLSTDGDLDMYEVVKAMHDTCPDICVRPDHGRAIWNEESRPGYGLYDRALGAAYLNGLFEAIRKGKAK
jgi:mannonate dehydratase